MRRLSGQAARLLFRILHGTTTVALTVALLAGTGLGVLAWRLGRGPIALPWLTTRIEAAADRQLAPDRLRLGQVALAWEGFHSGLGAPLDLRLTDVAMRDGAGHKLMAVPRAAVTLSLPALLRLRLVPRTIAIDRPRILLQRAQNGTLGLDVGTQAAGPVDIAPAAPPAPAPGASVARAPPPSSVAPTPSAAELPPAVVRPPGAAPQLNPAAILAELARPPAGAREPSRFGLLSELRRLLVRDANLVVVDRQLGAVWRAPHAFLDLARAPGGGVVGRARLGLSLGGTVANLTLTAQLPPGGQTARVEARLDRISPAALAGSAPGLAVLTAVQAPVAGTVAFDLGADLHPRQIALALDAGPGRVRVAGADIPITAATLRADGTPERIALHELRLTLPGAPGQPPSVLGLRGTLARADGTIMAAIGLRFDQVAFARLPVFWPAAVAHDARHWILENIPRGEARDGNFSFGLAMDADFSHLRLFEAAGTLHGTGLVVHWLRPIPPLVDGTAELSLHDPDRLDVVVAGGRQTGEPGQPAGLTVQGGTLRITGLSHHDQDMRIMARIVGSVPAALALLNEPRLGLLSRHKLPLVDPAGQLSAVLSVAFPLLKHLKVADVQVHDTTRLTGVHLARIVNGWNLDDGQFDLTADTDGLVFSGGGRLGGLASRLDGTMDFRAGPPGQVQQRLSATANTTAAALAAAGVPTLGLVSGPVAVSAVLTERRDGQGTVALGADLTAARIAVAPLGWAKPPGQPARLTADLPLMHDRLEGTAPIALRSPAAAGTKAGPGRTTQSGTTQSGAAQRGTAHGETSFGGTASAGFVAGRLTRLRLTRLRLGRTEVSGDIGFPGGGRPIDARLSGPVLDLAAYFTPRPAGSPPPPPAPPPRRGPAFTLAARFATVRLAGGEALGALTATGANDGLLWQRLHVAATVGGPGRLDLRIDPTATGRSLLVHASNAGVLAHGIGLPATVLGGTLAITGHYGPGPTAPLAGTATVEDFRLRGAPVLARLLQAVTLYGVVGLLQGPGLGVTRLVAPFQLRGGILTLTGARAFSASLGATAQGTIDTDRDRIDLKGTIVPAYFFNSLLGHVPLVGRLFSPERGGGVFAASYSVRGALKDPTVIVNPLTALTPGFLRGLFGLF
jgi:hypothetical protein